MNKEDIKIAIAKLLNGNNQISLEDVYKMIDSIFHKKRRNIVCLCGSTKFKETFEKAVKEESLKGSIVLTVAMFGHLEGLDMSGEDKKLFDNLHFSKIELADEILVLNVGGYIGESTKNEIDYAESLNKKIRYLEN